MSHGIYKSRKSILKESTCNIAPQLQNTKQARMVTHDRRGDSGWWWRGQGSQIWSQGTQIWGQGSWIEDRWSQIWGGWRSHADLVIGQKEASSWWLGCQCGFGCRRSGGYGKGRWSLMAKQWMKGGGCGQKREKATTKIHSWVEIHLKWKKIT